MTGTGSGARRATATGSVPSLMSEDKERDFIKLNLDIIEEATGKASQRLVELGACGELRDAGSSRRGRHRVRLELRAR